MVFYNRKYIIIFVRFTAYFTNRNILSTFSNKTIGRPYLLFHETRTTNITRCLLFFFSPRKFGHTVVVRMPIDEMRRGNEIKSPEHWQLLALETRCSEKQYFTLLKLFLSRYTIKYRHLCSYRHAEPHINPTWSARADVARAVPRSLRGPLETQCADADEPGRGRGEVMIE